MRSGVKILILGSQKDMALMIATTVGAATLTLAAMTVAAGKSVLVDWGDGSTSTYTAGAGARTHDYAGAGTFSFTITPASAITALTLSDNKITLNSYNIKAMVNMVTFDVSSLKAGTFNSADVSAWRPTTFKFQSMPAGYTGTFNSADVSAWRPTDFRIQAMPTGYAGTFNSADVSAWRLTTFVLLSMPASYIFTMTAGGFSGWTTPTIFNISNNSLTQAKVDQILSDLWAAFATRSVTAGTANVGSNNSAPSGLLQAANPPTTGKEFAYELVNDSQNINPTKKWTTITITA